MRENPKFLLEMVDQSKPLKAESKERQEVVRGQVIDVFSSEYLEGLIYEKPPAEPAVPSIIVPIDATSAKPASRAARFVRTVQRKGPMSLYVPGLLAETEGRPKNFTRHRNVRVSQTAGIRSPESSKIL